jgi:hypothetical protein
MKILLIQTDNDSETDIIRELSLLDGDEVVFLKASELLAYTVGDLQRDLNIDVNKDKLYPSLFEVLNRNRAEKGAETKRQQVKALAYIRIFSALLGAISAGRARKVGVK